ncbi:hypothetical protein KAW44_06215 [Candidatus Bipolaricaulota bacterium]|nr:hypothetical protein [Candidatus Bipolaricaulota bacterium]
MNDVPAKHRHSIRLKGWDYSRAGMYFVTICAQNRVCLFGDVVDGGMRLNDAGRMVEKWWSELNHKFPTVQTHEFVVMPNHVHGIIALVPAVGADLRVCPDDPDAHTDADIHTGTGTHVKGGTHVGVPLPGVVQWFKTMTTNEYIRGVKQFGWPRFDGRLWQRNYYEHIIRNDGESNRVREYIVNNPLKWGLDRENPGAKFKGPTPEEPWLV